MNVQTNNKEEKKKSMRRIYLPDIVLILLLILALVGVWQRENLQRLFSGDEVMESYTVTFEIKKMRNTAAEYLQKDTDLYLMQGQDVLPLGRLAEQVGTSAATEYFETAQGEIVSAVYPQDTFEYLVDVSGVLQCEGLMRDGAFLLDGRVRLAVNEDLAAYCEQADFVIRITSITKNP